MNPISLNQNDKELAFYTQCSVVIFDKESYMETPYPIVNPIQTNQNEANAQFDKTHFLRHPA